MKQAAPDTKPQSSSYGGRPDLCDDIERPYQNVALAIDFLVTHAQEHPSLEQTAAHVGLSPQHFQRVFKAGAGVSPKKFLQYLAVGRAKEALAEGKSVLEASLAAGLSGPSRLHDLILVADAMTPGSVRRKGDGEHIRYAQVPSPYGNVLLGATDKGICWLSFIEGSERSGIEEIKKDWPGAKFSEDAVFVTPLAKAAFSFATPGNITKSAKSTPKLGLHISGTNFQLKVWEALLKIPHGCLMTYGDLAKMIGQPKASRAVGTAVGANAISLLIPCHRVILSSGIVHNYRWGFERKKTILALEAAAS